MVSVIYSGYSVGAPDDQVDFSRTGKVSDNGMGHYCRFMCCNVVIIHGNLMTQNLESDVRAEIFQKFKFWQCIN